MSNLNTETLSNIQTLPFPISQTWESTKEKSLRWKQPKRLQRAYQLHSQDQIWGQLKFDNNQFISRARAIAADQEWNFKYTRFSLPKVTIQLKGDLVAQAVIETNWGWHGSLNFEEGHKYIWKSTDYAEKEFCFLTTKEHPVVFFTPKIGFLKIEADVEISSTFLHHPHLPLLTMLGWFLILLRLC
jgi:hypothetical protein